MNQNAEAFPSRHSEYPCHNASNAIPATTTMRHQ